MYDTIRGYINAVMGVRLTPINIETTSKGVAVKCVIDTSNTTQKVKLNKVAIKDELLRISNAPVVFRRYKVCNTLIWGVWVHIDNDWVLYSSKTEELALLKALGAVK